MSAPGPTAPHAVGAAATPRPMVPLLVIATTQLMLVLDDGITNIALPSIGTELGFQPATLPWVVNAYVLVFGGLLLFGGRLGDLLGRRQVLRIGLGVFIAASLLGGLAPEPWVLIAARASQGLGAALAAPSALALLATSFPQGKPRNQALAVYGAMSAVGIIAGVLLGGFLTGLLGWRSVFFINIPLGLLVLAGTASLAAGGRHRGRLDTTGAVSGTGAVAAAVCGLTHAGEQGWSGAVTVAAFVVAAVLLVVFIGAQARRPDGLLPLSLFTDRNRVGSYIAILVIGAGLLGTFYLLALYLQQALGYSAIQTGLAGLPFGAEVIVGAGAASKLVERLAPRLLAVPGLLLAAAGSLWLSGLGANSSFALYIAPAVLLTSAGLSTAFVPMTLTAVHAVDDARAGVASAMVNTSQQVGAAVGVAVFTTVSLAAFGTAPGHDDGLSPASLAQGYGTGYLVSAVIAAAAAVVVAVLVSAPQAQTADPMKMP